MGAGYLFQVINLVVAMLTVPLLLRYLNVGEYLLWSVFTTFGMVTVQLQSAIQFVSTRQIAHAELSSSADRLGTAIKATTRAYRKLAILVGGPFLLIGLAYINYIYRPATEMTGTAEWCLFVAAYLVTYLFAPNNAILLGLQRVTTNNNILSFTRVLNFLGAFLALKSGLAIAGICLSFLLSQLVGAAIGSNQARQRLHESHGVLRTTSPGGVSQDPPVRANIRLYAIYVFAAFALYNGNLLTATGLFPKGAMASYALGLQSNAMVLAMAQVPLQVWLSRFMLAIASGNREQVTHELLALLLVCNAVFLAGAAALAIVGNYLLGVLGSHVMLPESPDLLLLSLAFLVELNIGVLASFLVNKGSYKFVRIYAAIAAVAIVLGVVTASIFNRFMLGFVAIPLALQAGITLPAVARQACAELGTSGAGLIRGAVRMIVQLLRNGRLHGIESK